jgi:hypothetical protein
MNSSEQISLVNSQALLTQSAGGAVWWTIGYGSICRYAATYFEVRPMFVSNFIGMHLFTLWSCHMNHKPVLRQSATTLRAVLTEVDPQLPASIIINITTLVANESILRIPSLSSLSSPYPPGYATHSGCAVLHSRYDSSWCCVSHCVC